MSYIFFAQMSKTIRMANFGVTWQKNSIAFACYFVLEVSLPFQWTTAAFVIPLPLNFYIVIDICSIYTCMLVSIVTGGECPPRGTLGVLQVGAGSGLNWFLPNRPTQIVTQMHKAYQNMVPIFSIFTSGLE